MACDGSNINPVSLAELNVKLPNGQFYIPSNPTGQYGPVEFSDPARSTEHQLMVNGDYIINSKNTLAVTIFLDSRSAKPAFQSRIAGIATSPPGYSHCTQLHQHNAVLKLTTLLTNTLVNELHASGQRNGAHGSDSTPATPQSTRSSDHCSDHQQNCP